MEMRFSDTEVCSTRVYAVQFDNGYLHCNFDVQYDVKEADGTHRKYVKAYLAGEVITAELARAGEPIVSLARGRLYYEVHLHN